MAVVKAIAVDGKVSSCVLTCRSSNRCKGAKRPPQLPLTTHGRVLGTKWPTLPLSP